MKNFNQEKYLNDLKKLENQSLIGTNANEVFDKYHSKLTDIISKHAPKKTLSKTKIKLKLKPWISLGIIKSIKIKNKSYRKCIKTQKKILVWQMQIL